MYLKVCLWMYPTKKDLNKFDIFINNDRYDIRNEIFYSSVVEEVYG
jgi:hypothetical protein